MSGRYILQWFFRRAVKAPSKRLLYHLHSPSHDAALESRVDFASMRSEFFVRTAIDLPRVRLRRGSGYAIENAKDTEWHANVTRPLHRAELPLLQAEIPTRLLECKKHAFPSFATSISTDKESDQVLSVPNG